MDEKPFGRFNCWKHPIARILGNFGISFFVPLGSINIGESLFLHAGTFSFQEIFLIALLTALITMGVSASKEAIEYGNRRT